MQTSRGPIPSIDTPSCFAVRYRGDLIGFKHSLLAGEESPYFPEFEPAQVSVSDEIPTDIRMQLVAFRNIDAMPFGPTLYCTLMA